MIRGACIVLLLALGAGAVSPSLHDEGVFEVRDPHLPLFLPPRPEHLVLQSVAALWTNEAAAE